MSTMQMSDWTNFSSFLVMLCVTGLEKVVPMSLITEAQSTTIPGF